MSMALTTMWLGLKPAVLTCGGEPDTSNNSSPPQRVCVCVCVWVLLCILVLHYCFLGKLQAGWIGYTSCSSFLSLSFSLSLAHMYLFSLLVLANTPLSPFCLVIRCYYFKSESDFLVWFGRSKPYCSPLLPKCSSSFDKTVRDAVLLSVSISAYLSYAEKPVLLSVSIIAYLHYTEKPVLVSVSISALLCYTENPVCGPPAEPKALFGCFSICDFWFPILISIKSWTAPNCGTPHRVCGPYSWAGPNCNRATSKILSLLWLGQSTFHARHSVSVFLYIKTCMKQICNLYSEFE